MQEYGFSLTRSLREKCPDTEYFLVRIFLYSDLRSKSRYSVRIQENTDQKKLRIWTLFTPWFLHSVFPIETNVMRSESNAKF